MLAALPVPPQCSGAALALVVAAALASGLLLKFFTHFVNQHKTNIMLCFNIFFSWISQTELDGHENLAAHIREPLDAAVFNFGWLPGGDKSCTTKAATSIRALTSALSLLKTGGLAVAVLYPGHEAGLYEAQAIEDWAQQLQQDEFAVLRYGFINRRNRPPYLLAFEKLRQE